MSPGKGKGDSPPGAKPDVSVGPVTSPDLPPTGVKRRPGAPTAVLMRSRPRFGDTTRVDTPSSPDEPETPSDADARMSDKSLTDRLRVPGIRTPIAALSLPGATHFDMSKARPAGSYFVGKVLGEGGMGRVLEAKDSLLGRVVAMKTLHPAHLQNDGYIQALIFEACVAGRLEHPNIVPVYDLGSLPDGTPYYTMKKVEGNSLHDVLHGLREGVQSFLQRYTLPRLLQYFRGICMALDYAHDCGVIHRDLKPENVLLGSYGEVHVLDWGVARVLPHDGRPGYFAGRVEEPGTVIGTPHYMSPEQARGDTHLVDARSDIFSLGVILYQILTHTLPHQHSSTIRQIDALLSEPIIPPRERSPHLSIPVELERICLKALSTARADRYARVGEMWSEIEAWTEGERERNRLREMAATQTRIADEIAARYYEQSAALSGLQASMQRGAMTARPIDPLATRRAQWELELKTQEVTMIVSRLFAEAVLGYQHALAYFSSHRPAIDALVRLYRYRAEISHARNDVAEQIHYSDLARAIAPAPEDARGVLSVRTYPEGAEVVLYDIGGGRVAEHPARTSPVVNLPVRPGSYFVSVTLPGYRDRRDAVVIEAGETEQMLISLVPWDSSLPLAARGDDLFVMRDAFLTTLSTRRLGSLMVSGEAGVGKRKLLDEFGTWLDGLPQHVAYGAVRVERIHQHVPFYAIGKLIAHRAGIDHRDDAASLMRKMLDFLARYDTDFGDGAAGEATRSARIAARADVLLSLPVFRSVVTADRVASTTDGYRWRDPFAGQALSGEQRSMRVFGAIADVLRCICAAMPLVLAIRGADYLDRLTYDLFVHFAFELSTEPLLCVMFARADSLQLNCEQELALKPLEPHEVRHQLVMLLRGSISESTIRFFYNKSGGNAFYVAELARVLLDEGHLQQLGRQWRVPETTLHEFRDASIEDILGVVLRGLSPEVLEMLSEASIAGHSFWAEPIAAALGRSIDAELAICVERKIIAMRPECNYVGIREYGFRQDWMQRRLYRDLDPARRASGHRFIASFLQEVIDGSLPELALVAKHFRRAGAVADAERLEAALVAEAALWEREDAPPWFGWPDDPRSGTRTDD